MDNNTIFETTECRLDMLSASWAERIVIYLSSEQFGESGIIIKNAVENMVEVPVTFCELVVNDWDRYLTPWKADINMNNRVFIGEGVKLLTILKTRIIPKITEYVSDARIYIAGYSLAGLFALWSLYESDIFEGCACCSGSLWYPGWEEYTQHHDLKHDCCVYLSLGKKEKRTKHPVMQSIEDNMLQEYEQLEQNKRVKRVQMDWNEGGHFNNIDGRMESGISWLISE